MKLVRLTAPNGDPVWINPELVCAVSPSRDGASYAKTAIRHAGGIQYVCETPDIVVVTLVAP